jgi:hypothetical protein
VSSNVNRRFVVWYAMKSPKSARGIPTYIDNERGRGRERERECEREREIEREREREKERERQARGCPGRSVGQVELTRRERADFGLERGPRHAKEPAEG